MDSANPSAALRKEEHAFADTLSDRLFALGKGERRTSRLDGSLRRGRKRGTWVLRKQMVPSGYRGNETEASLEGLCLK
jgi:hypothetical protein